MADYIYYVTVSGSTFLIDGEAQAELGLKAGLTYRFDVSDASCASQTFKFSTTSDGTHGGGSEYTTNVTLTGTAGSSGAVVDLVVPSSTGTLYYYNGAASGYGGTIRYTTDTYVSTTNLGLKVPLPGASDDVWASHLNASLRTIDSVVEGKAPLDSPTFTGTISGGTLGSGVVFPAGSIVGWEGVTTTPIATQGTDLTYTDLTGSSKSYTPTSGSSYVVYEYNTHITGIDAYPLLLIKFIFDGSEQSNSNEAYYFYNAGSNFSTNLKFRYILSSWTGAKTMSLQYRCFDSANNELQIHKAKYSGNATTTQVFVKIHQITYSVM